MTNYYLEVKRKMEKIPELMEGEIYGVARETYLLFTSKDKQRIAASVVMDKESKWVILNPHANRKNVSA